MVILVINSVIYVFVIANPEVSKSRRPEVKKTKQWNSSLNKKWNAPLLR